MNFIDSINFSHNTFDHITALDELPSAIQHTSNLSIPSSIQRLNFMESLGMNPNSTYNQIQDYSQSWDREFDSQTQEPEITEMQELDIPESEALAADAPAGFLGAAAAAGATAIASHQATQDVNKDLSGQGVAGSSFGAAFQARTDSSQDQAVGIENAAIIAGSALLGPESLAVGMIGAGINSALNTPAEASVQSNLGTDVPVSNLAP